MSGAAIRWKPWKTPGAPSGATDSAGVLRFSDFEFDIARDQLRRGGAVIALSPKPAALLRYLLRNPQRLIGKQELMEHIWGGVVVTDDSLVQCVGELRARLGEQGGRLITTHPRRGYMFDAPVRLSTGGAGTAAGREGSVLPWRRWPRVAAALAAVAVALAGTAGYLRTRPAPYRIDDEIAKRFSIVVAPPQDIGSAPSPPWIREGLAEELAAQLSHRANVFGVRPGQADEARYVMTSSLETRGKSLRIHLQVRSNPQGALIWTERYDYPDASALGITSDVAQRGSASLWDRHAEMLRARMSTPGYRPDGADLVLSGWDDLDRRQSVQDVLRARSRLEQAMKIDPDSVNALTGLGATLMSERFGHSGEPLPVDPVESDRLAERAITVAPDHVIALINWANVQLFRKRPDLAVTFFERAANNAPEAPNTRLRYAAGLMYMGRLDEAQAQCDAAMTIGRRSPRIKAASWYLQSNLAFARGDDDKAYALAQRALAERPSYGLAYANLAAMDILHGHPDEAREHMAQHLRLMPSDSAARFVTNNPAGAEVYRVARDRLVAAMKAAGLPEQ